MNDFSEIENDLKKLRPIEPSPELVARIEADLREGAAEEKIVTPARFRVSWVSLGSGLAAAAVLLLFVHLRFNRPAQPPEKLAAASQPPAQSYGAAGRETATTRSTIAPVQFVPAGTTQVVYRTEDEGLLFPTDSDQPLRRVRARTRETLQWQNPRTGASLRISYPTEEVTLLPVYGQ